MKAILLQIALTSLLSAANAQRPQESPPDLSSKALITKSTPSVKSTSTTSDAAALHKIADDYYAWRNENYPVQSSEAGLHTWDNQLTDYAPAKIAERPVVK